MTPFTYYLSAAFVVASYVVLFYFFRFRFFDHVFVDVEFSWMQVIQTENGFANSARVLLDKIAPQSNTDCRGLFSNIRNLSLVINSLGKKPYGRSNKKKVALIREHRRQIYQQIKTLNKSIKCLSIGSRKCRDDFLATTRLLKDEERGFFKSAANFNDLRKEFPWFIFAPLYCGISISLPNVP